MKARTFVRPMVMVVAALALLAVLLVSRPAPAEAAQTVTVKVADGFPTTHYVVNQATKPWMDRVVQLSKTKVEFQYFPSGQLGKLEDMMNLLRTQVADVVYASPATLTGEFPLHGLFGLPGLFDTSKQGWVIYQKLLKEGPLREEFTKKGARPLIAWSLPNYELFTTKKAILRAEDVKSLKVRSFGGAMDSVVKAFGAVPVQVQSPDMFVALERGTVDGVITPFTSAKSYKLEEVCKYATMGARLSSSVPVYTILEDHWQKLPADVRDAMTKASEEVEAAVCKYQDDQVIQVAADYEKRGMQINRLSSADAATWRKALEPVTEQWIKQMEAKGLPGRQVVDACKKAAGL